MSFIPVSDPVCSHNGLAHIEGEVFWLACTMTFQGAWAPLMTWYRGLATGGDSEPLESVVSGTAANVTEFNPRVSYTVTYTFTRTISAVYAGDVYRCVTTFPAPPSSSAVSSVNSKVALNDLNYQHTFTSEQLVMHCKC